MFSKHFTLLMIMVAITIIYFGCKSDTVTNSSGINSLDTSGFTFPFQIGNSWSYTEKVYASDIHPDSILHHFSNYPYTWTGTVTILYDTVVNNIQTRCFLEVTTDEHGTSQSRSYLINNDTALMIYAVRGGNNLLRPPNDLPGNRKTINPSLNYGIDEALYYFNPPYVYLKYPVVTGKIWVNLHGLFSDTVTSKYEGYELINVGAGSFKCMKVSTVHYFLTGSSSYDYYCKFGMLKRHQFYNDMIVTTEWYPEGIGTVDLTFITTVNSFNIP